MPLTHLSIHAPRSTTYTISMRYFILSLLAAFLLVPTAMAQVGEPQTTPEPVEVTGEELDAIALAYVDVQNLIAEYQTEFGDIQDPQRAVEVQQELATEADAAIEARGIDPERYGHVIEAANADPELLQRLTTRIEALIQTEDTR